MQTPQLIIAVSRLEQQPEFLPGENRIKQAQGCRNSRLLWWDSHIPTRATVGAQKKFLGLQVFFFPLQCIFSSCSLFFVEPESILLCVEPVLLEPAKKTWGFILSQTLHRDQERPLSSREEKCLWTDKIAHAGMGNEYFVDQVQPASNSTADWWELGQSTRIIINTFRGQWNTPGSYKSLKSYITAETPVLDSNPAARGWKFRL